MFNPISCGKCIAKINDRIHGLDPREMIKACAWLCLKTGKREHEFKKCLEKKLKIAIHEISHADQVVNSIWNKIKHKCRF